MTDKDSNLDIANIRLSVQDSNFLYLMLGLKLVPKCEHITLDNSREHLSR